MLKYELEDGDLIVRGIDSEEDVIFTTEHHGAFNVSKAMLWAIEHGETMTAQLDVAHALRTLLRIDLDAEHLLALNSLSDEKLDKITVLLYIDLGDGTHMLIDANHRLAAKAARAARNGVAMIECPAFVISLADAQAFRVRYFAVINGQEKEIAEAAMLEQMTGVYSKPDGTFEDRRTPS